MNLLSESTRSIWWDAALACVGLSNCSKSDRLSQFFCGLSLVVADTAGVCRCTYTSRVFGPGCARLISAPMDVGRVPWGCGCKKLQLSDPQSVQRTVHPRGDREIDRAR